MLENKCLESERVLITSTTSLSNALKTIVFNLRSNALNIKSPSIDIKPIDNFLKSLRPITMSIQLLVIFMILYLLFYAYEYYTIVIARSDLPIVSDIDINTSLAIHDLIDKIPYSPISNYKIKSFSWRWELQLECWSKIGLVAPVIMEMPNINTYRNNKLVWVSNPFYAFKGGYLMCMKVSVVGYDDGEDTYMSVYLYLMKGQYDDELNWPMRGEYTITLESMRSIESYYLTVYFDANITTFVENYQRVMMGKINRIGIGFSQFISHAKLFAKNFFSHQQFLSQHNSLFFKISYRQIV